jgi:hypothetical protein
VKRAGQARRIADGYAVLAALMLCAAPVGAQQPEPALSPSQPRPLPPALAIVGDTSTLPFERPNGLLLRPGRTVYDLATIRGDSARPLGIRTVEVTEATVAGMPAWLLAEARTGTVVETGDSLYLSRADLAPQRWVATSGRSQLGASFSRDTLYGALQSYQGRSSFTMPVRGGTLVTPAMVERIVELLPLHLGYRALASLVVVELGAPRIVPAELAVDREETLSLVGVPTECWVVTLRAGASDERLWVAKTTSRVVRTEQATPGGVLTATVRP